jgi:hypothetical protein
MVVGLKGSALDKSKALVKGKGSGLPNLPLPVTASVSVQIVNGDNGLCRGAIYTGAELLENEVGTLHAKAP